MHYSDSGIYPTHKSKSLKAQSKRRFKIIAETGNWFNYITHHWSIHKKIGSGYILSIGIAILGTGVGLMVGEYYDDKGVEQFRIAQQRYTRIDHLEKAVWQVKFNQQKLIISSQKNELQPQDIKQLQASIAEANNQLFLLKYNLKDYHTLPEDYATDLKTFLQVCDREVDSYTQLLESLLQKVTIPNPTKKDIAAREQILQEIVNGKQGARVEQLSQTLEKLVDSTGVQEKQAGATFRRAKVLRLTIIIMSMVLSMAIAMTLALYTSRAIARPIKAVTKVAKQATQESNFELQAPVTSDDEIGVLATSLNQLIQQVATQIRELKQAQAQLIQGEKMSSLGQMVAGIAHEINNPVNFIYANLSHANDYTQELLEILQLYQQYYPQPEPEIKNRIEDAELDFIGEDLPKIISSMHTGAERIRQIILSLRNFCHLDESEMKQVDINEGINNTLLLLNHRLNPGIEVINQYEKLPLVECYPAQLNQVFWHIITNAIDELISHHQLLCDPQILIQTKLVNGQQVEVRIRDNGKGISPSIQEKIFDPFFTTKQVGEGTGMGLAICYQIVEKHQGKIQVISQLDQGTEFVVTLPIQNR
ncbi:sensor histidine kinase [Allocoleopsis franciscana]|uniref:histidine kinase n=2 Tax=Allocoleopsis TaxID=2886347 RepID=K9WE88_9CYAN|nr:ATP-binding protein [Allocoleopsis franciscana]AFZ18543.1 histidine kinase,HAMP domain-containing protein,histidine kinase [Allocoleopsis franciscana PCC 7113]